MPHTPTLAAGLLVPDIPLEETGDIRDSCNKHGLDLILLVTPTTPRVSAAGCGNEALGSWLPYPLLNQ